MRKGTIASRSKAFNGNGKICVVTYIYIYIKFLYLLMLNYITWCIIDIIKHKHFQKVSNMKRQNKIFGMMNTHIHIDAKTDQQNIRYIWTSNWPQPVILDISWGRKNSVILFKQSYRKKPQFTSEGKEKISWLFKCIYKYLDKQIWLWEYRTILGFGFHFCLYYWLSQLPEPVTLSSS